MKLTGLTSSEISERRRAGLTNTAKIKPSKSTREIITSNIFTYFNLIFTIIALLLAVIHSWRDLTFIPIVLANSLIGIFQELHAKKILDSVRVVHAPRSTVIRNGEEQVIPTDHLVLDDLIVLKAGDQIPADAIVIKGEAAVNESLLTGEPDEIPKAEGDQLLSGSFLVHGELYARLTKVGRSSYANQLAIEAKAIKTTEQSKIISSLNRFVKMAGIAIIPLGIVMFLRMFIFGDTDLTLTIQRTTAALIAMIPEGLYLLASVTLVLSTARLAQRQVLLHDMKSIETLARVDTLCVDKTGTITTEEMQVIKTIISQNLENVKSTSVKSALKSSSSSSSAINKPTNKTANETVSNNTSIATNNPIENAILSLLSRTISVQKPDSATMIALQNHFKTSPQKKNLKKVQGFSSQYKYSGAEFIDGTFVIGSPDSLIKKSEQKPIAAYVKKGYRVLVLAEYQGEFHPDGHLDGPVTPLAFVILENQIRPEAAATFQYFTDQGVDIKVISGDNPLTVSEIAKKAHIPHADRFIDVSTLKFDSQFQKAIKSYTVFGRVTPDEKRKLVKALKSQGHTVAMTGDGVNDVLALKDADCSIAMASGAQAAIQSAQVVLLDSDFAKMPAVVLEGRRVVNNLQRSGSLFLVKNLFSFATAVLSIIAGVVFPLAPAQVSLVTMWAIGIPSFLLAQIPNHRLIRGDFMKNIIRTALPAAIAGVLLVAAANVMSIIIDLDSSLTSTICTLVWAIVGIANLFRTCFLLEKPENPRELHFKIAIFALCLVGIILCIVFLPWLFELEV